MPTAEQQKFIAEAYTRHVDACMSAFGIKPLAKTAHNDTYFDTSDEAITQDTLRYRYRHSLTCFPAVAKAVRDGMVTHKRLLQSTSSDEKRLSGQAILQKAAEGKKECKKFLGYWQEYLENDSFPTGMNYDSMAFLVWCRWYYEEKVRPGVVGAGSSTSGSAAVIHCGSTATGAKKRSDAAPRYDPPPKDTNTPSFWLTFLVAGPYHEVNSGYERDFLLKMDPSALDKTAKAAKTSAAVEVGGDTTGTPSRRQRDDNVCWESINKFATALGCKYKATSSAASEPEGKRPRRALQQDIEFLRSLASEPLLDESERNLARDDFRRTVTQYLKQRKPDPVQAATTVLSDDDIA